MDEVGDLKDESFVAGRDSARRGFQFWALVMFLMLGVLTFGPLTVALLGRQAAACNLAAVGVGVLWLVSSVFGAFKVSKL